MGIQCHRPISLCKIWERSIDFENLEARATADKWMDWASTTIRPGISRLFHSTKKPNDEWSRATFQNVTSEEIYATADGMVKNWLILNKYIKDSPFVAGDNFSMGDIPVGMQAHRWYLNDWINLARDGASLSHLDVWYGRLCDRPEFLKVMAGIPKTNKFGS